MNFELTEEQKEIQKMAREFAKLEFPPILKKYEKSELKPEQYKELFNLLMPKFKETGFLGVVTPEKYDGAGLDTISSLIIMEEFAKSSGSLSLMYAVLNSLTATPLSAFGTEEQKEKYLRPMATGEKIGCYCLTEPGAGSDVGAISTRAQKTDKGWIMKGTKSFITHALVADYFIVFAKDDETQKISAFIIEKETEGIKIGKTEHKAGLWASPTSEVIMEDCFVLNENLLGKLGKGMTIALMTLDTGRLYIAAQALGLAQGAWDWTSNYLKQRQQFGKPITDFQGIYMPMAFFATRLEAARLLIFKAATLKDAGEKFTKEASMAKLFATETGVKIIADLQLFCGGVGFTEESPLPMYYRDVAATRIYEGANNIQRLVIARSLGITERM